MLENKKKLRKQLKKEIKDICVQILDLGPHDEGSDLPAVLVSRCEVKNYGGG
jgi:hypothetical protein